MRIVWANDIHLNFSSNIQTARFFDAIRAANPDVILLLGDIAEGNSLPYYLSLFLEEFGVPVLFVLGNHDYYRSSVRAVREHIIELTESYDNLTYLSALRKPYKLNEDWALVGVDGWGDGRVGAYMSQRVQLSDWELIADFAEIDAVRNMAGRLKLLQKLSDVDAQILRKQLWRACEKYPNVLSVSHVPPVEGAAWHEGKPSDRFWAPWFVWRAGGESLLLAAEQFPTRNILALCGHTHGSGSVQPRTNLTIKTGAAFYGYPEKSVNVLDI